MSMKAMVIELKTKIAARKEQIAKIRNTLFTAPMDVYIMTTEDQNMAYNHRFIGKSVEVYPAQDLWLADRHSGTDAEKTAEEYTRIRKGQKIVATRLDLALKSDLERAEMMLPIFEKAAESE